MPWAEASREMTMLPGMIEMVVNIAAPGVVPHPFFSAMHVRGVGMAFAVIEVPVLLGRMRSLRPGRAMGRDILAPTAHFVSRAAFMSTVMLREGCHGKHQAHCQQSNVFFHFYPSLLLVRTPPL
jgi:hypothetical protein